MGNGLLVSIRPQYAAAIFDGRKSAELRRLRPRLAGGDLLIIYVCSPTGALLGSASVERVIEDRPTRLWRAVAGQCALTRAAFRTYFCGAEVGFAIFLCHPRKRDTPITLDQLRQRIPGFRPPQGYKYLRPDHVDDRFLLTAASGG